MKCIFCNANFVGDFHICRPDVSEGSGFPHFGIGAHVFRGQMFFVRVTEDFVYLYPPECVKTRVELQRFSPTEVELSSALGYKVEFVDYMGLVDIYEIIRDENYLTK